MVDDKMTTSKFCDILRDIGRALASGEKSEVVMPVAYRDAQLGIDSPMTPQYMRQVINRVPEVKAKGRASVKQREDEEGVKSFVFTLNEEKRKTIYTPDDLPRLEQGWRVKFIKHILKTNPVITDLRGEQLEGAAIALDRFAQMLRDMCDDE